MFRFGNPPNYEPKREDSIAAIAAREGRAPQEVAYDILIEDDGRGLIYTPISNYANYDLSASEGMLANRNSIMGLGDGGAHVGFILDAGYQTWLITHWGATSASGSACPNDPPPDLRHGAAPPGCTTAA